MIKHYRKIFVWLVLSLWASPVLATAAASLDDFNKTKFKGDLSEALNFILKAIPTFLAPLALLAIVWAGILYMTSFGDAAKAESAKKTLTWAIIGLVLTIGFWAILKFITDGLNYK